jgi:hypothetical protein
MYQLNHVILLAVVDEQYLVAVGHVVKAMGQQIDQ